MRRALRWIGGGLGALLLVLVVRALAQPSRQPAVAPLAPPVFDATAVAERLGAAVRIATISHQDPAEDDVAAFLALHRHLDRSFPALHATLAREVVNERSLLFTWAGSDPSKKPILLMGHLDVVPVEAGTEQDWTQPPFSGALADGFVWGRGTIDTKSRVYALCEAVEWLIGQGFRPERTVLLAFGHDEEVGGRRGAAEIARRLGARGLALESVLDEGGFIASSGIPGIDRPVALVSVAEKGYATVTLTVVAEGGHSSMPPGHTALGTLASAIRRLEASPMPARVRGPTAQLFDWLAPEMSLPMRVALANHDLLGPLLARLLATTPPAAATVRTTTAVTMAEAGVKENVLPGRARAVVNFRILPGDSVEDVLAHVRRVVADPAVEVALLDPAQVREASAVSRTDGAGFALLARTIRGFAPDAIVAPNLGLGGTDARHMTALSDQVFRFSPLRFGPADQGRAHGTNERVAIDDYARSVGFYVEWIRAASR